MINIGKTPQELRMELAERFSKLRLLRNLSRKSLSEASGVPAISIKKFEHTGEISMQSFIALSIALDKVADIESLYQKSDPQNVEELKNKNRLRGRK